MKERNDFILPDERDFKLEQGVVFGEDGKLRHDKILPYKYFAVMCKMGHAGKHLFVPKILAVKAFDAKAAAQIARYVGRVKHDRKDAIIFTTQITEKQYAIISDINDKDPFMQVHDFATQKTLDAQMKDRVMREPETLEDGLTAEKDFYGPGYSLQNFIVARLPYSKRANGILVEEYIEENRHLWERSKDHSSKPEVAEEFREEVEEAIKEYHEERAKKPTQPATKTEEKPKAQGDGGQGQV